MTFEIPTTRPLSTSRARLCLPVPRTPRFVSAGNVSLPVGSIGQFVDECRAALDARWPSNRSYYFGHIGDSNLHVTVDGHSVPGVLHHEVYAFVYDMVVPYRGSVSAEHGIGLLKREFLPLSRSPEEIAAMTAIKRALDPNGILNPGKLI